MLKNNDIICKPWEVTRRANDFGPHHITVHVQKLLMIVNVGWVGQFSRVHLAVILSGNHGEDKVTQGIPQVL